MLHYITICDNRVEMAGVEPASSACFHETILQASQRKVLDSGGHWPYTTWLFSIGTAKEASVDPRL